MYCRTILSFDFVLAEECGQQFATKEKPWIKSRFTVMLSIKCDFIENRDGECQ